MLCLGVEMALSTARDPQVTALPPPRENQFQARGEEWALRNVTLSIHSLQREALFSRQTLVDIPKLPKGHKPNGWDQPRACNHPSCPALVSDRPTSATTSCCGIIQGEIPVWEVSVIWKLVD